MTGCDVIHLLNKFAIDHPKPFLDFKPVWKVDLDGSFAKALEDGVNDFLNPRIEDLGYERGKVYLMGGGLKKISFIGIHDVFGDRVVDYHPIENGMQTITIRAKQTKEYWDGIAELSSQDILQPPTPIHHKFNPPKYRVKENGFKQSKHTGCKRKKKRK